MLRMQPFSTSDMKNDPLLRGFDSHVSISALTENYSNDIPPLWHYNPPGHSVDLDEFSASTINLTRAQMLWLLSSMQNMLFQNIPPWMHSCWSRGRSAHVHVLYIYFLTQDRNTWHELLTICKGWQFLCILCKLIMQVFSPQWHPREC